MKYENGYMFVNALTLPGNSGSPILDVDGNIVGIHHSSAKKNDAITRDGLLYVGRASSAESILEVLNQGILDRTSQLAKFWNVDKPTSLSHAKKFSKIYIKSKTIPVLSNKVDFFSSLYNDCNKKLDLDTNHAGKFTKSHDSCTVAKSWLSCNKSESENLSVKYVMATTLDDSHPDFDGFGGYPKLNYEKKWANLFLNIAEDPALFMVKILLTGVVMRFQS